MILILTDKFDKHADLVCTKLNKRGERFFRLDLDTDSLKRTRISFRDSFWRMEQNGILVNSNDVRSVWLRRPFVEVSLEEENISDPNFRIWQGEWNKTLLGLYNSLRTISWLNPLAKSYQAENKYLQMEFAKKLGFSLPDFIVSNNKEELLEFARKHNNNVVMKPMNQQFYQDIGDGKFKGLYVNKITETDLKDFENSCENPIFLQSYIDKSYEVRYTVVGEDHHSCRIESQKSKKTIIDWRRYDILNTPHYPMLPPDIIKGNINKLMQCFGLYFGAIDFIVSPSGEWYFLEINTMGQWLWIEELTGLNISDSIVDLLIKHSRGEK
jgi:glutathione synthase/RimK-type ligase-like ATP-grasp enzyme